LYSSDEALRFFRNNNYANSYAGVYEGDDDALVLRAMNENFYL
jgi:hypothetical protein